MFSLSLKIFPENCQIVKPSVKTIRFPFDQRYRISLNVLHLTFHIKLRFLAHVRVSNFSFRSRYI